jgi:hypothetical protein
VSSANRAERRRQERGAAKQPTEVDGLRLVYQRGEGGDCLRGAVATVLGIDYDDTPAADAYSPDARDVWHDWADARGLKVNQNMSHAPAYLPLWIAIVVGQAELHAVVMRYGRLLHNPSPGSPQQAIGRRDVQASMLIGDPAWVDATKQRTLELVAQGSPEVWELQTQHAAAWHRANGREARARAMELSLAKRTKVAA